MTIPEGVSTIPNSVFSECRNLKTVILSEGVKMIEDYAFSFCTGLESITIPESVTTIGESAFYVGNSEMIIYGTEGSAAQIYAETQGYSFAAQ